MGVPDKLHNDHFVERVNVFSNDSHSDNLSHILGLSVHILCPTVEILPIAWNIAVPRYTRYHPISVVELVMDKRNINHTFPAEIMGEIFLRCIPPDPLKYQQPNVGIAPIVLCHVCSHWREIALNTPYLWTHLYHVGYTQHPSTFESRDLAFLTWWRDNAKNVPLSLRLELEPDNRNRPTEVDTWVDIDDFLEFMPSLLSNARYINLDYQYQLDMRLIQELTGPKLDTIVLPNPDLEGLHFQDLLPVTPKQLLRRVFIGHLTMDIDDLSSNLNFSIITHLHIVMSTTIDIWFSLLQRCTNLTHASFFVTFRGGLDTPIPNETILPHLRQLSFTIISRPIPRFFLEGVSLPSLVALHVETFSNLGIDRLHRILSSTPSLRTLELGERYKDLGRYSNFALIRGDLDPTDHTLPELVPHLSSIQFEFGFMMSNIFHPEYRHRVISVLNGDWLALGKPGNCLSSIWLGSVDGAKRLEIIAFVKDIQSHVPKGVKLAARSFNVPNMSTREQRHKNFTDEFEDLVLEEN